MGQCATRKDHRNKGLEMRETAEAVSMMAQAFAGHKHLRN
jgi:hypothetical protein